MAVNLNVRGDIAYLSDWDGNSVIVTLQASPNPNMEPGDFYLDMHAIHV
jgi:hypothetical protein